MVPLKHQADAANYCVSSPEGEKDCTHYLDESQSCIDCASCLALVFGVAEAALSQKTDKQLMRKVESV